LLALLKDFLSSYFLEASSSNSLCALMLAISERFTDMEYLASVAGLLFQYHHVVILIALYKHLLINFTNE
jgi:hypothetical protein